MGQYQTVSNICVIEVLEGEEKENQAGKNICRDNSWKFY